ncbi:MAG: hypothetical protein AB7R90_02625 [Reyranellaceae bacterium]
MTAMQWRWPLACWLRAIVLALGGLVAAPALAQGQGQGQGERGEYAPGGLEFRLPDRWSVETSKQKLTLVAPDEDAFIQFSTLQPGNDAQLRAQVAQVLTTHLADTVVADPGNSTTVNGMPGFRVSGNASSDATPVQFVALALTPAPGKPVLVLAYAAQDSFPTHAPVFEALIRSLKRR